MSDALKNFGTLATPQSRPIPGKDQVENSAGGFVYIVDRWTRLHRFLILGSDGGTYYVNQRKLTEDNAACVFDCLKDDGQRVVQMAVDISKAGRAPKNDQAIFVLALALNFGEAVTDPSSHSKSKESYWYETNIRQCAARAVPEVCRTGTHIFQLATYIQNLGGWGEVKKNAIRNWLFDKSADELAYQMVKYRMREGWTQHDLHHMAHPRGDDREGFNNLFRWAKGDRTVVAKDGSPEILYAFEAVQNTKSATECVAMINAASGRGVKLPHEAIPTEFKNDPKVQDALLQHMPIGALVRNLGNLSKSGLLVPFSEAEKLVLAKLSDGELLTRARMHPMGILTALKTYESGHGFRGAGTWSPLSSVVDALNEAFYLSFGNVEPIGGNVMIGLDVSGSMGVNHLASSNLSAREAACAMSMITARTEKNWMIGAFTTSFAVLSMSPTERLDDLVRRTARMPFGGTDCSQPMLIAAREEIPIDTFIIYTDNETWAGTVHASQALVNFRRKMNKPNAKLIVCGMTSTGFTIADPNDAGMMDVVGFDTATPNVMSDFARIEDEA